MTLRNQGGNFTAAMLPHTLALKKKNHRMATVAFVPLTLCA